MENEELELDATSLEANIELDSLAYEAWEQERREAEQNEDEDDLT